MKNVEHSFYFVNANVLNLLYIGKKKKNAEGSIWPHDLEATQNPEQPNGHLALDSNSFKMQFSIKSLPLKVFQF